MNQTEEIEMTYRDLKLKIKNEQKTLAQQIKNGKSGRKPTNRNDENYNDWDNLVWNKWIYRHIHIGYCEFFNHTPYEKIEGFSHVSPDRRRIDNYKNEWEGQLDEALRDCA